MPTDPVCLVTMAPGHFHAALVQKEALRGVDPHTHVYAPLDPDLVAHLDRIARFNARPNRPTYWTTDVHASPDWFGRFLAERPGNTVVIAGRNRPKIDLILAAVSAGYCVLADKPWIVEAVDLPKLDQVFEAAERNGVFAWDIMTERFEPTNQLQQELIGNPDVFGEPLPGTAEVPTLELESVHYLSKHVAGVRLRRPAWWFDPAIAGEGLADVGTHLADLALGFLFSREGIEPRQDVHVVAARRWPTRVELDDFRQITGLPDIPEELAHLREDCGLSYWGNGTATVRIRGHVVRLTTRWGVRPAGPEEDTHYAVARGSRSTVTVCHDPAFGPGPQVFVIPMPEHRLDVIQACGRHRRIVVCGERLHIPVPDNVRKGHESHFAEVLKEFVGYRRDPGLIPKWDRPRLLAKYHITTRAVELARRSPAGGAP